MQTSKMSNSDSFFEEFVDVAYPRSQVIHLALAESKPTVSQTILKEIKKDNRWVPDLCANYQQLVQTVTQQAPDLVLLGTLEDINWLEVCRRCLKQWQGLPIILLVDQAEISDFFRNWVIDRGVRDVVSIHQQNIHLFRKSLLRNILKLKIQTSIQNNADSDDSADTIPDIANIPHSSLDTLTWESTLVALNRLTKYSSSYLGPLAIANYWKKSHASLVSLHPALEYWQVDYQGQITCPFISEQIEPLTAEQLQDVQTWVRAFLKECERVIVDFSKILQSKSLSADIAKLIPPVE